MSFTHLHLHVSDKLEGYPKMNVTALMERVVSLGQNAVAITDHCHLDNTKEFVAAARKKDIKPIVGCEIYITESYEQKRPWYKSWDGHLILLAKNSIGLKNLSLIVAESYDSGFYGKPRVSKQCLVDHADGMIVLSAGIAGEVSQSLLKGDKQKAKDIVLWYKDVFGDDYYLEVMKHENRNKLCNNDLLKMQDKVNPVIFDIAKETGIKIVATNDVLFIRPAEGIDLEHRYHSACSGLTGNALQHDITSPDTFHFTLSEYLKSEAEMLMMFPNSMEAIYNTEEIVDKVSAYYEL